MFFVNSIRIYGKSFDSSSLSDFTGRSSTLPNIVHFVQIYLTLIDLTKKSSILFKKSSFLLTSFNFSTQIEFTVLFSDPRLSATIKRRKMFFFFAEIVFD